MNARKRGRPRKFDESEVLDRITDVFWEHGFAATSLDTLSEATGLARPSLYGAFGSKEQMYLAALENYFARMSAKLAPAAGADASLPDVLASVFEALIKFFTRPSGTNGCMVVCTAAAEAPSNEAIRKELDVLLAKIDGHFLHMLDRAQKSGELPEDVDAPALAKVLAGVAHTIALRARAGQRSKALRPIAQAAITLVNATLGT